MKNNKIYKFHPKHTVIPIGIILLLISFKISVSSSFALTIGLCLGSILEKSGWND